jgi:hypothetical protein
MQSLIRNHYDNIRKRGIRIHAIEYVALIAKFAVDLDVAALGQYGINFFPSEHAQHPGDVFT